MYWPLNWGYEKFLVRVILMSFVKNREFENSKFRKKFYQLAFFKKNAIKYLLNIRFLLVGIDLKHVLKEILE